MINPRQETVQFLVHSTCKFLSKLLQKSDILSSADLWKEISAQPSLTHLFSILECSSDNTLQPNLAQSRSVQTGAVDTLYAVWLAAAREESFILGRFYSARQRGRPPICNTVSHIADLAAGNVMHDLFLVCRSQVSWSGRQGQDWLSKGVWYE